MINKQNNTFLENEQLDEGAKEMLISLAFIAQLLAFPKILSAQEIYNKVENNPTHTQIHDTLNKITETNKVYNGYSEAKVANILARTLFLEAAGESEEGKRYVATVIWNRSKKNIENSVAVCFKHKQFSCWNSIGPATNVNYSAKKYELWIPKSAALKKQSAVKAWNDCKKIAMEMINGTFETKGKYNIYYNPDKSSPAWKDKITDTITIGHHIFGYDKSQDKSKKKVITKKQKTTYPTTTTVKKGELGVSYVAKRLISTKQTSYTNVSKLTNAIIKCNNFKKDKKGNPIIHVGDSIKLPVN